MALKGFYSALSQDLPVLFAYIGWSKAYDGTEAVIGGHSYLKTHPRKNSEVRAFVKEAGFFRCGIGRGQAPPRLHVVFLATDPEEQIKRIVGVYAGATVDHDGWCDALTHYAVRIPVDRRPGLVYWPTGQGIRRWASRDTGRSYLRLRNIFDDLKAKLPRFLNKPPGDELDDQTYAGMEAREGQRRKYLVAHRHRETKVRKAKIQAALSANDGKLVCEVPGCGFDFFERYGEIGYGYAHVHHRKPLSLAKKGGQQTSLGDLAIVCANCHAMIHNGGECRDLATLIPD